MSGYIKTLPENIITSLEWYTGGNYDKLNSVLRNDKQLTYVQNAHKKNIDLAFSGAPRLTKSITVYKGKNSKNVYSDKAYIYLHQQH